MGTFQRHVNRCLDGCTDDGGASGNTVHLKPPGIPVAESMVSLSSIDSPTYAMHTTASNRAATAREFLVSAHGLASSEASLSPSAPPISPQLAAVRPAAGLKSADDVSSVANASADFYQQVTESVEFICELCPEFPRASVEELLIACGNDRDMALTMLFEMRDEQQQQQQQAQESTSQSPDRHGGSMRRSTSLKRFDLGPSVRCPPQSAASTGGATVPASILPHPMAVSGHHHHHQRQKREAPTSSTVELVVYDLQPDGKIAKKLGMGVYHSGVIVYGHEFSFGGSRNIKRDSGKPGIWATRHLRSAVPVVKKSIVLGETFFTPKEIQAMIKEWASTTWRVDDYHLLAKNCNHFSEYFLQALAEKSIVAPPVQSQSLPATTVYNSSGAPESSSTSEAGKAVRSPSTPLSIPAGVTPLPRFPVLSEQAPQFPLSTDELKRVRDAFRLPSWVNRAAKVGDTLIPEFVFKKILEALMPPVPEDEEEDSASDSSAAATPAAPSIPLEAAVKAAPCDPPSSLGEVASMVVAMKEIVGPDVSDSVCVAALKRCDMDIDRAVMVLLSS